MTSKRKFKRRGSAPRSSTPSDKKSSHVDHCWNEFRQIALVGINNPVQLYETRKAFIAGMVSTFVLLRTAGDHSFEASLEMMKELQSEIENFGVELTLDALKARMRSGEA